jgi:hypothetical protein
MVKIGSLVTYGKTVWHVAYGKIVSLVAYGKTGSHVAYGKTGSHVTYGKTDSLVTYGKTGSHVASFAAKKPYGFSLSPSLPDRGAIAVPIFGSRFLPPDRPWDVPG